MKFYSYKEMMVLINSDLSLARFTRVQWGGGTFIYRVNGSNVEFENLRNTKIKRSDINSTKTVLINSHIDSYSKDAGIITVGYHFTFMDKHAKDWYIA